jgi:hypothetical protein
VRKITRISLRTALLAVAVAGAFILNYLVVPTSFEVEARSGIAKAKVRGDYES